MCILDIAHVDDPGRWSKFGKRKVSISLHFVKINCLDVKAITGLVSLYQSWLSSWIPSWMNSTFISYFLFIDLESHFSLTNYDCFYFNKVTKSLHNSGISTPHMFHRQNEWCSDRNQVSIENKITGNSVQSVLNASQENCTVRPRKNETEKYRCFIIT